MKKLTLALASATILTGLSTAQGAPSLPLEGNWGLRQTQGAFTFAMTFTIQNKTLTLTNDCSFEGNTVSARVSSPAQYDDHTLDVLAAAEDQESRDGVNCNVSLKPDHLNYRVEGATLVLSHDGSPDQITLQRQ